MLEKNQASKATASPPVPTISDLSASSADKKTHPFDLGSIRAVPVPFEAHDVVVAVPINVSSERKKLQAEIERARVDIKLMTFLMGVDTVVLICIARVLPSLTLNPATLGLFTGFTVSMLALGYGFLCAQQRLYDARVNRAQIKTLAQQDVSVQRATLSSQREVIAGSCALISAIAIAELHFIMSEAGASVQRCIVADMVSSLVAYLLILLFVFTLYDQACSLDHSGATVFVKDDKQDKNAKHQAIMNVPEAEAKIQHIVEEAQVFKESAADAVKEGKAPGELEEGMPTSGLPQATVVVASPKSP